MQIHMCTCACTHTYTYAHTYINTRTQTYTCLCTHTQRQVQDHFCYDSYLSYLCNKTPEESNLRKGFFQFPGSGSSPSWCGSRQQEWEGARLTVFTGREQDPWMVVFNIQLVCLLFFFGLVFAIVQDSLKQRRKCWAQSITQIDVGNSTAPYPYTGRLLPSALPLGQRTSFSFPHTVRLSYQTAPMKALFLRFLIVGQLKLSLQ